MNAFQRGMARFFARLPSIQPHERAKPERCPKCGRSVVMLVHTLKPSGALVRDRCVGCKSEN